MGISVWLISIIFIVVFVAISLYLDKILISVDYDAETIGRIISCKASSIRSKKFKIIVEFFVDGKMYRSVDRSSYHYDINREVMIKYSSKDPRDNKVSYFLKTFADSFECPHCLTKIRPTTNRCPNCKEELALDTIIELDANKYGGKNLDLSGLLQVTSPKKKIVMLSILVIVLIFVIIVSFLRYSDLYEMFLSKLISF